MKTIRAAAVIVAALGSAAAAQFVADFDAETEGVLGPSYTTGGINFFDANNVNGFYPDGQPFTPDDLGQDLIIEQSTVVWNDFPEFVSFPNTLTFGRAFIPGDNVTIGPLATVSMSASGNFTSGGLDLIYYENGPWGGIEVTLEAISRGSVVASSSFTVADGGGRDNPAAIHLSVGGVEFDSMRLYSTLGGEYTTVRGLVDNVTLVPGAGTLGVMVFGVAAAMRRRRA